MSITIKTATSHYLCMAFTLPLHCLYTATLNEKNSKHSPSHFPLTVQSLHTWMHAAMMSPFLLSCSNGVCNPLHFCIKLSNCHHMSASIPLFSRLELMEAKTSDPFPHS